MTQETPLRFFPTNAARSASALPSPRGLARALAGAGIFLRRHRGAIVATQWCVVLFYSALVVIPAFLPVPPRSGAHILDNLRLFAQFVFWGLWWPGVMLATVFLGRVWCGFFCPEGYLSELASRHGRGKAAPGWLKWPVWPFIAFVITTVYGQLISVYEYAEAALLILGGSTLAAVAIGLIYGRGRRVWCRYLCPASGVFAVLAKIAPLHYKVDRVAWDRGQAPQSGEKEEAGTGKLNCPPLVDVRRMVSASDCHACARCAGQHGAVRLAGRSPFSEILDPDVPARTTDALTLLFGVLGVATAAFQWTVSPWFLQLKIGIATWLVEHDHFILLESNAPWWLLTHYPERNDVFTWLDGLLVLGYLLGGGFLLGVGLCLGPLVAAWLVRRLAPVLNWQRFALALAPLGATSVILGLTMTTVTQLRGELLPLPWVPHLRIAFLAAGCFVTLWLILALIRKHVSGALVRMVTFGVMCLPVALMATLWSLAFLAW
ncbi:MAG: 4Fe-4S binding protein [Zoogloeaceae bacterium]|jgi:hypothetical protein|nr:4Fe-4S binding protein [Zoogloeaceae bacterium]